MGQNAQKMAGSLGAGGRWKVVTVTAVTLLSLTVAAGTALAGDGRRAGDYRDRGAYESKIYGTVESMPQDLVGTWVVSGREIAVTADTRIKEKHGRVETGVYVEVEGNTTDKTFTAYEIKVKRSKQSSR